MSEHAERYRCRDWHGIEEAVELLLEWNEVLDDRITRLEQAHLGPASFIVTIPNTAKDPKTMADQLPVTATDKRAVITFFDAHGNPTPAPPGALVAYSSSDPTVVLVDGPTGALTPVGAAGTSAVVSASPQNPDGTPMLKSDGLTPVTGTPDEVDLIAGPPDTFTVGVA